MPELITPPLLAREAGDGWPKWDHDRVSRAVLATVPRACKLHHEGTFYAPCAGGSCRLAEASAVSDRCDASPPTPTLSPAAQQMIESSLVVSRYVYGEAASAWVYGGDSGLMIAGHARLVRVVSTGQRWVSGVNRYPVSGEGLFE